MPALWDLAAERLLPDHYAIVGYALNDWNDEAFRAAARESAEGHARNPVTEAGWHDFARGLFFVSGSSAEPEGMASLGRCLTEIDDRLGTDGRRMSYLATPPSAFTAVVDGLRSIDRNGRARVVVEKPFGSDLASASELNRILRKAFTEQQIFRIDHYLGKETVQNIFVFRFANAMFERIWNRDAIDHVQITVAESVGVEGRGRYYEEAGAVRDMIQNHVLQVLAFLAMEPPRAMDSEAIRDEKVKVLRSLRPVGRRGFGHRDVRRHSGVDRQLALGGGPVLPPNRQTPATPCHGNSADPQRASRLPIRGRGPPQSGRRSHRALPPPRPGHHHHVPCQGPRTRHLATTSRHDILLRTVVQDPACGSLRATPA